MILSELVEGKIVQTEVGEKQFSKTYDVIVLGMGAAGCMAVVVAAQKGMKVLGIDSMNCMGGMATAGAVYGYYFGSTGGLYEEIDNQVFAMEKQGYTPSTGINPEMKKYIMEQHALDGGADLLYEAVLTGVYLEGNRVVGARWFGPNGEESAGSKIVIDGTGDAYASKMAGCQLRGGREIDGQVQPFSNVLVSLYDGRVNRNYTDCGYLDPNDPIAFSHALLHSETLQLHYRDSYEDCRFFYVAPLLGLREGSFIIGEDSVTFDSYIKDDLTNEPLFYAYSNIDNHGKDLALESESQQDWAVGASLWGVAFSVPVSLGALIPKGLEGIMTAGRCISIDHDMAPCVRMIRDMQKCGEAAAIAAVVAIKDNVSIKDADYNKMLPMLLENNCLDETNNVKMKNIRYHGVDVPSFDWITNKNELKEALASDAPGIGIWSAKRLGNAIRDDLRYWVDNGSENLKKHSAMALAMIDDSYGLPVLRQMVEERDGFVPLSSRKYNQARGYASIYLIGRLRDVDSVPLLLDVVSSENTFEEDDYKPDEFISNIDEYYFQYISHAMMALLKIGQDYKEVRSDIAEVLMEKIFDESFSLIITYKAGKNLIHDITGKIREVVSSKLKEWGMFDDALKVSPQLVASVSSMQLG